MDSLNVVPRGMKKRPKHVVYFVLTHNMPVSQRVRHIMNNPQKMETNVRRVSCGMLVSGRACYSVELNRVRYGRMGARR